MKKYMSILILISLLSLSLLGCGTKTKPDTPVTGTSTETDTQTDTELHHIEINVKDYGKISVELDPSAAPITVENFMTLVKDGFYDGLTFHRIMDGFMIQGGNPTGTGRGGSDQTIKGEFSENGVDKPISHVRGVISMARAMDNDSASSQFFIVQSDSTFLDGKYAGFGTVTDGMGVVDAICKAVPVTDNNGTVLAENQPIITSIKVID